MAILQFEGKAYKLYDDSLVTPIYNSYKNSGYDVKKLTATNGAKKESAILIRGSYNSSNEFQPYLNLVNGDTVGAKAGGNSKPQFLAKASNGNVYCPVVLNQAITFNYKYQVDETWGSYSGGSSRPIYTTVKLEFTTWSSRFPLENNYLCSFGKNTFTLPAGSSSGNCGDSGVSGETTGGDGGIWSGVWGNIWKLLNKNDANKTGYSENEPQNGLKCLIFIKSGSDEKLSYTVSDDASWTANVPATIRDKTATHSASGREWKEWSGPIWWFGHRSRTVSVTYLNANTEKWDTVSDTKENSYGYGNGWAYKWPDWPSWPSVSFTVPGGTLAFDGKKSFTKTYVCRAVRGSYGSGTESQEWRSYTYSSSGSTSAEKSVTFSFSYEG